MGRAVVIQDLKITPIESRRLRGGRRERVGFLHVYFFKNMRRNVSTVFLYEIRVNLDVGILRFDISFRAWKSE